MNFRYYYTIGKLIIITVTPVLLLLLPAHFFDGGESVCLSKLLLDRDCPACGLTRACMHLIHFNWEEAYAFNMMSFLALPMVGIVWLQWALKEYKIFKALHNKRAGMLV
ncbi:DUF2752 domain-containing protein [Longitalea luteola]|uniref:DUF2752 domain-containing protein n=1 Tax=Longitalea luteola TaxID=2812563 RepID=UPI001A97971F|nr:DUF2752 domain-containing protein [Longitalea luteola]